MAQTKMSKSERANLEERIQKAEEELQRTRQEMDAQVATRTAELQIANEQLRQNETRIRNLLDQSEQSRRALLSILEDEKQVAAALRERERHSQSLLQLSKVLERAQTYGEILNAAQEQVSAIIGYQSLWAYLLTEDKKHAHVLVAGGPAADMILSEEGPAVLAIEGDPMLEEIAAAKDIVVVADARTDPRTDKKIVAQLGNRTIVNVPIMLFDKHLGSVGTGTFGEEGVRVPTEAEQQYLAAMASHMAVALDRIHLLNERTRAMEALRESEARYHSLFENSIDGILLTSPDGGILSANPEACRLFGYTEQELCKVGRAGIVDPNDPRLVAALQERARTGRFRREFNCIRKDGTKFPAEVSSALFTDKTGHSKTSMIIRDMTERKHAEEKAEQLAAIVQSSDDAIIGKTLDGIVTSWNKGAEKIYGYVESEMLGKAISLLVPLGYENEIPHLLEKIRSGEHIEHYETLRQHKDGQLIPMSLTISPIRDAAGKIVAASTIGRDITARKRDEAAMQHLNRELRAISNCNQTLMRATDEETLLDDICKTVCHEAGYRLAWVGYAEHDDAKTVRHVAWAGAEDGYIENVHVTWAETERGRGPIGTAIWSGETVCIQDIATDERVAPWRDNALRHGHHSHIVLPLKDESANTFGVLNIYSPESNAFTPDEIRLLEELAGDLAFGITSLRTRTKRKRAEQALRESERQYRLLAENISDVIWILNLETGRFRYVSSSVERLRGYTAQEVLVQDMSQALTAESLEYVTHTIPERIAQFRRGIKRTYRDEIAQPRKDGSVVLTETSVTYQLNEETGQLEALGVSRDITERKRAEEEIALLSFALNNVQESAYLVDENSRVHFVNEAACRALGYTRAEILTLSVSDLDPDFPPERWTSHWHELQTKRSLIFETKHKTKNGRLLPVEVNANYIEYEKQSYNLALAHDITERKQAEQEHLGYLQFLESMDRVNRAIQGANTLEQMMSDVLDLVLAIFDCDRASLVYPCDPEAATWWAPMERTKPEFPGVLALGHEVPMDPEVVRIYKTVLASEDPVGFGPGNEHSLPADVAKEFSLQSQLATVLYPKVGKPYMFVMHQCSRPRVWTSEDGRILKEIGRRLSDALTGLLTFRELEESEQRYRQIFENTSDVLIICEVTEDRRFKILDCNPACAKMVGLDKTVVVGGLLDEFADADETTRQVLESFRRCVQYEVQVDEEIELVTPTGNWYEYATLIPLKNASGIIYRLIGVGRDITEQKRAEQERLMHLHFLESMDRVNQSIQGANTLEQMMSDVLDLVLVIFDCDRAFLQYPCDPDATFWWAPMERNKPEYPGVFAKGVENRVNPEAANIYRILLAHDGPVQFGPRTAHPLSADSSAKFGFKSFMSMAIYPKVGSPWQFGIHQCAYPRIWTLQEERLLQEIGRRMSDALTGLLTFRNLQESEERYRMLFNVMDEGVAINQLIRDQNGQVVDYEIVEVNPAFTKNSAFTADQVVGKRATELYRMTVKYIQDWWQKHIEMQQVVHSEFHYKPTNRWFHITTTPPQGNRFATFSIDITESKRAEQALRDSEARYRIVADNTYDWEFWSSPDGQFLYNSPSCERITGYRAADFVTEPDLLNRIIHPEDREKFQSHHQHPTEKSVPEEIEVRILRADGNEGYIGHVCQPVFDEQGTYRGRRGSNRDITKRKHAEQALRESEERLRQIASSLREAVWLRDARTREILYVNPAFQEITGQTCESFYENRDVVMNAVHPDDKERVSKALDQRFENVPFDNQHRIMHRDGSVRWVSSRSFPVRNEAGQVYRWASTMEDITERKQAEQALRDSERRLAVAQQMAHVGYWERDFDAKRVALSDEACRIFGISEQGMTLNLEQWHSRWLALIYPQDQPRLVRVLEDALAGIRPYDVEYRIVRPDGAVRFVYSQADIKRDASGQAHQMVGMMQDITERKQAEQALRESEERYRALVENSSDIITILNADGTARYESPAHERILGYTSEEMIGQSPLALVHPDDLPPLVDALLEGIAIPNYTVHAEYRMQHKDGSWHTMETVAQNLLENPAVQGIVVNSYDITARKEAEQALQRLNQELEQRVTDRTAQLEAVNKELEAFAYSVSHDLRAPLRHIDGFLGLLRNKLAPTLDPQSEHYIVVISNSARRMGTLIDDLLSFSRAGRLELSKTRVELNPLVQEVLRDVEPDTPNRIIHWQIADLPVVTGDRAMLRIVFVNLLSNALKFTEPRAQAEIEIGFTREASETVLYVRDNGVGFDMQYADKLFGVFQRLHRADEFEGTGIGLANVRRIISRHGGRTWAEGQVNHGATFYFSLPELMRGN